MGQSDRLGAEGASGLPQKCVPIRFRAMRATHLRGLVQAFLLGFPGCVAHVGGAKDILFLWPLLNSRRKGSMQENADSGQDAMESGRPARNRDMDRFTWLPTTHRVAARRAHARN